MRVIDPAELFVRSGRLGPVTLADELDDAFALIDLLAEHLAQVSPLGPKNVLPNGLVTQKSQSISDELPGTPQLLANRGNKDGGTW